MKRNFKWTCKHTWKRSAYNTLWCLIGCSIGDFGTIMFFQLSNVVWPTFYIMILAIINGLITSVILETSILLKQMNFSQSLRTALGMSFISMISMEIVMNMIDTRRTLDKSVDELIENPNNIPTFKVKQDSKISYASACGLPLFQYAPTTSSALSIGEIGTWCLNG